MSVTASREETENWTTVISSKSQWFDLHLSELWRYRDLIVLFVRRDFIAQYKQTLLGPLWHVINPIITTLAFTLVFGRIAGISTDGLPPFMFYLGGTVTWTYFSRCLTGTSNTFVSNAGVFGKVYFPRLTVPISVLISQLTAFGIQFAIFAVALAYFAIRGAPVTVTSWVLLTPVLLLIMALLGLGLGIVVSSLTTRYRDLGQLVTYGVTLLMYLTPVIYPLSVVPMRYRTLMMANPLTAIVEGFRYAFLGRGLHSVPALAYSAGFAAVALVAGIFMFSKVERTFMDSV